MTVPFSLLCPIDPLEVMRLVHAFRDSLIILMRSYLYLFSYLQHIVYFYCKLLFLEFLNSIDKLKLAYAQLQTDPSIATLKLMDYAFIIEEVVNGNPSRVTKSRDPL